MPRLARAEWAPTLRFVPTNGLTLLDPSFADTPFTRAHAYLVFDTLYGLDDSFTPQPQMVQGHTVEADGRHWRLTLREGLRFHDGTPVLARDVAASIRRCAIREGFCQALLAATDELVASDDRTFLLETVGARLEATLFAVDSEAKALRLEELLGRVHDLNAELVPRRIDRVGKGRLLGGDKCWWELK